MEPAKEETVVAVAGVIDGTEKEASAEIHYKKEIVPVKGPEKRWIMFHWTGFG